MLLGGVKVVGLYVWPSDSAFKNSTMIFCQVTLCEISFLSTVSLCCLICESSF